MAEKKNYFQMTKTIGLIFNFGNELYYSKLNNGEKMYHWLHVGLTTREDTPDVKVLAIILPFVYIAIGYRPQK